jgi:hypothetical protein
MFFAKYWAIYQIAKLWRRGVKDKTSIYSTYTA